MSLEMNPYLNLTAIPSLYHVPLYHEGFTVHVEISMVHLVEDLHPCDE